MRNILILAAIFYLFVSKSVGQQKYIDFDNIKLACFEKQGRLDSICKNPDIGGINNSSLCGKYIRSPKKYDNIKVFFKRPLKNVDAYATYVGLPQKFKMKLFTNAPVGTLIEIQLGTKGVNGYPEGVHSQFHATTTVQNSWEELAFTFAQTPVGNQININEINQLILLFAPNSISEHAYYFDDIQGPELIKEEVTITKEEKR